MVFPGIFIPGRLGAEIVFILDSTDVANMLKTIAALTMCGWFALKNLPEVILVMFLFFNQVFNLGSFSFLSTTIKPSLLLSFSPSNKITP